MLHTIGHSTRALDEFVALLCRDRIGHIADVRTFPASRRYPHFNGSALAASLAKVDIEYSHHPALGGRRVPHPDSLNVGWRNASFRGYADHMRSDTFDRALNALLVHAVARPTAIMCAEAVPWRCHRSLIADAVLARGEEVTHILDAGSKPHVMTPFAIVTGARVSYPAPEASRPPQ